MVLAGGAGAALLVLLGVWFIFRGPNGEEIARVQLPDGGSVTVQQPVPTGGPTPVAAPTRPVVSFFTANAPSLIAPPPGDYALKFAENQRVEIPNPPLDPRRPLTVEAMVHHPSNSGNQQFAHFAYSKGQFTLQVAQNGNVHWTSFSLQPDGTSRIESVSEPFPRDRRVHVAGVRGSGELRLYFDGKLVQKKPMPPGDLPASDPFLTLGGGNGTRGFFDGVLDEVRISQVERYTADFTPVARHAADADTIALYHCDEGFGDVLKDASGKGRDGRIIGASWVQADGSPIPLPAGAPTFISTTSPSAVPTRWPLAASKPADIQWLVGLGADVTLRVAMPSINTSIDQTIKSVTEIPAGPATIVGVHFMGKAARVTDADLARLCGFVDLESLSFDNDGNRGGPPREITGQGWGKLASLKHLRSLKLEGCRQVTVLPDFMASLTALESLDLQYPDAAEWARAAAAAPALKRINAYRTQLGDDGLAHLEKRTSLQQIDLRDSRVTQAAVDRFAAAVPQCRITWGADKNPTVIEPRVPPPSTATLVAAPPPGDYVLEFTGFGHTDGGAWVDVPSLMLSETGPLTLEARVWRLGHNEGYVLGTENVGIRLFGGQWAAVASQAKTKTFPSEIRRWYHLAAVRTDGELRMYVDGKRIDAQPLPPRTGPQSAPKSNPLKIGGNSANIRLDEIRISKTARFDQDFTPQARFEPDADTLAIYHCDDGAGDVLKDASGNGHDGKITKPSWVLPDGAPIPTTMFAAPPTTPVAAPPAAAGVVYLDELTEKLYFGLKESFAKPGRNSSDAASISKNFAGAPLDHALSVHPEDPKFDKQKDAVAALPSHQNMSRLVYDLDGKYALFQSGFRSRTGYRHLQAEVWGDGKKLWESGAPLAQHPADTNAEVDVRGIRELTLFTWCDNGKSQVLLTEPRLTPVAPVPPGGPARATMNTINLLPLVDVTQDKIKGSWELKNGELHTGTDTGPLMLEFPYQPPEEYDFTIEFTYTAGGEIHQFLARQGRGFSWALGAMGYRFSGFERIDGKVVHENPTKRDYRPQFNQRHVSRVEVRNDGLRAYLDGKLIGEWKGDYKQLDAEVDPRWPFWKRRDPSRLAIGTKETPTIFHKAEVVEVRGTGTFLRPPAPIVPPTNPPAATVDLLPLIDPVKQHQVGDWRKTNGILQTPGGGCQAIRLPIVLSDSYRLDMLVARTTGVGGLSLGLVVGGYDARFIVDSLNKGERLTMLDWFAGKAWDLEDYLGPKYVGEVFRDGAPMRLQVDVTPASVVITADDKKIIEWSGEAALIGDRSPHSYKAVPGLPWLGGYGSEFQISKLTYTPLGAAAAGAVAKTIPAEAHTFNGHRYLLVNNTSNGWNGVNAKAKAMGGHLATIDSKEERDWLRDNIIRNRPSRAGTVALGGVGNDDVWSWITDEPFDRALWLGAPTDVKKGRSYLCWVNDNHWNPEWGHAEIQYFLVEWHTLGPATASVASVTHAPDFAPPPAVFPFDAATALKHQAAWSAHLGVPVEFTNGVGMKFRLIPPGEFQMGLGPEFIDAELIRLTGVQGVQDLKKLLPARPAHPVRITRPFYMQVEEVSSGRYRDVVGQLRPEMEQDPSKVLQHWVAWLDAIAFCNRLSERDGKRPAYRVEGAQITPIDDADGYRLPTEAQWEYACRAGTNTLWYFGNDGAGGGIKEFRDRCAPPNPFGLTGLYGGSNEWCWDATDGQPYSAATPSPREDPREEVGTSRIKRGGSNNDGGGGNRVGINSFVRALGSASEASPYTGFGRVVLPVAAATSVPTDRAPQ